MPTLLDVETLCGLRLLKVATSMQGQVNQTFNQHRMNNWGIYAPHRQPHTCRPVSTITSDQTYDPSTMQQISTCNQTGIMLQTFLGCGALTLITPFRSHAHALHLSMYCAHHVVLPSHTYSGCHQKTQLDKIPSHSPLYRCPKRYDWRESVVNEFPCLSLHMVYQ